MSPSFAIGQNWLSQMEPELGVGTVTAVQAKQVEVRFGEVVRRYSIANAPLIPYLANVAPRDSETLFDDEFSSSALGKLRLESIQAKKYVEKFEAKGWVGGRVQVIPHQISIAKAIVDLMPGRFWLADEVGLGKTITAGLALHHLCQVERIDHILILVPDALIIQWFIELYRRFNLPFTMLNEYFTDSTNPDEFWAEHKFCLSSYEYVMSSPALQSSILNAGWDLLILDEAHHLEKAENYSSFYLPLITSAKATFFLSAAVDTLLPAMLGANAHIYRSTRAQIPLFPQRVPHLLLLNCPESVGALKSEFLADEQLSAGIDHYDFREDPRLKCLIALMRESPQEKILLITHTQEKAIALQEVLRQKTHFKTALFHEGMTLVQRDRMAAYFAENEEVQLLICSEIGSEGRNFQFCHRLFLFDYPLSLDLLEQRIGRLDRIGQTSAIHLYLPYVVGTPQASVVNWLSESIGLFNAPSQVGDTFLEQFRERLLDISLRDDQSELVKLIHETIQVQQNFLAAKKLLAIQPVAKNTKLLEAIVLVDKSPKLEQWFNSMLEHFELELSDILDAHTREYPYTFSRKEALLHENYTFLTWDHPLIENALTLILNSSESSPK